MKWMLGINQPHAKVGVGHGVVIRSRAVSIWPMLFEFFRRRSSEYNVNDGVGEVCRSSLISALWHKSYANGAVLKK